MIELQDISFAYGEKKILDHFNLRIEEGDWIAILGRSGRGKTTLLRLIAGLEDIQQGAIIGLPADGISMVFQEDRLIAGLNIWKNIQLTAKHLTKQEIITLLEKVGLGNDAENYPDQLSGGMKRRAALIRAIACERECYLMDEPFKGLDGHTKYQVMQMVQKHLSGKTVLMVTHDLEEAEFFGAKIITLPDLTQ